MYNSFRIGSEETGYELNLSGYDATVSTLDDGFAAGGHINAKFQTLDSDDNNCATQYTGGKAHFEGNRLIKKTQVGENFI